MSFFDQLLNQTLFFFSSKASDLSIDGCLNPPIQTHICSSMASVIKRSLASSAMASDQPNANFQSYPSPFSINSNLSRKDLKDRNVQWVFLGSPGVGKGTYTSQLCNLLGVPHIATGDLVREELSSFGPLSQQIFFKNTLN